MEQTQVYLGKDKRIVSKIAKIVLAYLAKHDIPWSPRNYEEWFFVVCRALEDHHIVNDKNLEVLYSKYIEEFHQNIDAQKREITHLSESLQRVAKGSEKALDRFDDHLDEHNRLLGESAEAIEEQNIHKIGKLQKRIEKLEKENEALKRYLQEKRVKLEFIEKKFETVQQEANIDALTKVFSRKKFEEDMQKLQKEHIPFSVIFLDIDDFKRINDTYGHQVGDRVLREIGEILNTYLRKGTFAYRYGGEEFVVILLKSDLEAARSVAERLKEVIEHRSIRIDEQVLDFTASFGVVQREEDESVADVLKRADEALYEAKRSGKNRVVTK